MGIPEICPLCNRPLTIQSLQRAGKRFCSLCRGKIGRYHKWQICSDGRIAHKDCQNPTGKTNTEDAKGLF